MEGLSPSIFTRTTTLPVDRVVFVWYPVVVALAGIQTLGELGGKSFPALGVHFRSDIVEKRWGV